LTRFIIYVKSPKGLAVLNPYGKGDFFGDYVI
jgi:hypothetical protein